MLSIFIIDFFIHFSVSRSTPPSCGFLCPWHIVRVTLTPQPLSYHHPSHCSVLAPTVSCHVRLSSWSRRGSRVSKRTVNFPGWRLRAINNPKHRLTVKCSLIKKRNSYANKLGTLKWKRSQTCRWQDKSLSQSRVCVCVNSGSILRLTSVSWCVNPGHVAVGLLLLSGALYEKWDVAWPRRGCTYVFTGVLCRCKCGQLLHVWGEQELHRLIVHWQ